MTGFIGILAFFRLSAILAAAFSCALQGGAAQAAMKTQWIDYKQGNAALSGYLVYDDAVAGKRPGVLMAHDRSGFSESTLRDAEMIASPTARSRGRPVSPRPARTTGSCLRPPITRR